jgi:hypothetical protein
VVAVATRGVHTVLDLQINVKNHRGLVGNTTVGTTSQLVCHRFQSGYGHGGSSPLLANAAGSGSVFCLILSFFIDFIGDFSPSIANTSVGGRVVVVSPPPETGLRA